MKTTIETINGQLYTVLWHDDKYNRIDDYAASVHTHDNYILFYEHKGHIATALPALPKHPKPEEAQLLYRYMAEGIYPNATENDDPYVMSSYKGVIVGVNIEDSDRWIYEGGFCGGLQYITHATDSEGNHLEIAIKEDE